MGATHSYNLAAHLGIDLKFTANETLWAPAPLYRPAAATAVALGQANYVYVSTPLPVSPEDLRWEEAAAGLPAQICFRLFGRRCNMPWLPGGPCTNGERARDLAHIAMNTADGPTLIRRHLL